MDFTESYVPAETSSEFNFSFCPGKNLQIEENCHEGAEIKIHLITFTVTLFNGLMKIFFGFSRESNNFFLFYETF